MELRVQPCVSAAESLQCEYVHKKTVGRVGMRVRLGDNRGETLKELEILDFENLQSSVKLGEEAVFPHR